MGDWGLLKQGAEARIFKGEFYGRPCLLKERFKKNYRQPALDELLTKERTKAEVRMLMKCRLIGLPIPALFLVELEKGRIYMEYLEDAITVKDRISSLEGGGGGDRTSQEMKRLAGLIGQSLGRMHSHNIIHGDLTTSNMLLRLSAANRLYLIDFGLSFVDGRSEEKGVDLYVLERAILSTHPNCDALFQEILQEYAKEYITGGKEVLRKLDDVRLRGRKRTMVG
ncbi:unnamed protein product [Darwinula stevensoni]|uniref:non-specific serine/threonine protein kinase n=1 Tax=Darwinula stevensoni TaxID=69355 RepID=A0A7R8X754_9CRUS|nr:unnamed protein product [Darwinula stevensoni]CAG0888320.1 unnamed protein product [Darwinula stevensoni]